jgi:hypothetical protein
MSTIHQIVPQSTMKLNGQWQADSPEITSMYNDLYEFTTEGIFRFYPNAYNGMNRIIFLVGRYKIKGDSVYFLPLKSREVHGGRFERSMYTTLSDTWEINGGKIITTKCEKCEWQSDCFKLSNDSLVIGNRKFFKIKKE